MLYISLILTTLAVLLWKDTVHTKLFSIKISLIIFISFLLSGFYYVADYLTGNGIDEAVIYHLTSDMTGAGFAEFTNIIVLSFIYLIVAGVITFIVYKIVRTEYKVKSHKIQAALAMSAIIIAFYVNPGVTDIVKLYGNSLVSNQTPEKPKEYITSETNLVGLNGKNIVYIYLESVERTYLDESIFPGLTPNLQKLEKQSLAFTDVRQIYGSGWTIAGFVNSQCGTPLVTPSHGNSMSGNDHFLPEAQCLGDILGNNGYSLQYMGGASLDFAGKGNFFQTHGFSKVEGVDELIKQIRDPDYRSSWGLYDDDLFDLIKQRYDVLTDSTAPFGLFALTLDTHHPNGHMSKQCENIGYEDGNNPMLNAIHCADKMVADLVEHIKNSDGYENTIVIISSDHLAMRNAAWDQLQQGSRKNLFMVLGQGIKPNYVDNPIGLIDVAPTILGILGAKIEGLGFGRNVLANSPSLVESNNNINDFLSRHRGFISSLWDFPQIKNGLFADIENNLVRLGDRHIKPPAILTLNQDLSVNEVRFEFYSSEKLIDQVQNFPFDQRFLWIDSCNKLSALSNQNMKLPDNYCVAMGAMGSESINVSVFSPEEGLPYEKITRFFKHLIYDEEIVHQRLSHLEYFNEYGVAHIPVIQGQNVLKGRHIITSAGGFTGSTIIDNLDNSALVSASRGLTLFGVSNNGPAIKLKHLDTCGKTLTDLTANNYSFQDDIDRYSNMFGAFAILAHDSAVCGHRDLTSLFAGTGLNDWKSIGFRTPYIGLISGNGAINEFSGASETRVAIKAKNFIHPVLSN